MENIELKENFDLTSLTTFKIPVKARWFATYNSVAQLKQILRTPQFQQGPVLHIGSGSNLLFVHDYDGLVIKSEIKGIQFYHKNKTTVYIIAGASEEMDQVVRLSIANGCSGLENLSGIPGTVGAAPVQNVGAYGVEAGDLIFKVETYDSLTHTIRTFTPDECQFGYRDSFFKNEGKGRYVILRVCFKVTLSDTATSLTYGPLKKLQERLNYKPTPLNVREEVIKLRNEKLPDPSKIGSAGSFFKNPVVSKNFFEQRILTAYPSAPHYDIGDTHVKIPAGWLIEKAGMKGISEGGAKVYDKQCLVIVNNGCASADDVVALSEKVQKEVNKKFSIRLSPEVNFIDTHMYVEVLGSGTSRGVPENCCLCDVCTSDDERDKRLRASVLIKTNGLTILIDPSPDIRQQLLRAEVYNIDAILITHSHYDHVGGIDDLRAYCEYSALPVYMLSDVEADLKRRIDYCFKDNPYPGIPHFDVHTITPENPFYIKGLKIVPIKVMHAKLPILGFRIYDFAYITDAKTIPEEEIKKLVGVKYLIINALRRTLHFSHFNLDEALSIMKILKPESTFLTHLSHDMGRHVEVESILPPGVKIAYDGLKLEI